MTRRRSLYISFGFVFFLILVGLAGVSVAGRAETAILESQAGEISTFVLDPTEAGFRAFTTSSETALVLHTAVRAESGAELVGLTLLAGANAESGGEAGGSVVTIPPTFADPAQSGQTLAQIFASAGLDALVSEVSRSLRIGFGDVVVLDASSWTSLMAVDLPLTLTLREDLVNTRDAADGDAGTDVFLEAGTRPFALNEIALIAGHRNPQEPGLAIALRHQQVWRSWISRTAGADVRPDLFAEGNGFASLIGSLANAEVSYRVIDTMTVTNADPANTVYEANGERIADLISQIVPFPEPVEAGDRPTVLLLDRSLGATVQLPFVTSVTRSGALVTVIGNSEANADISPEVQVHDPSATAVADEIAQRLGYPAPRSVEIVDATTAITVVIG